MTALFLVGFLIVFAIVVALFLYNKDSLLLKIAMVTILFFIASLVYFSFDTYKGWATKDYLPDGQLLYASVIDPTQGERGHIYVWVIPKPVEDEGISITNLTAYKPDNKKAPRAYELPYSKKLASDLTEATRKIKKGARVDIEGQNTKSAETDKASQDLIGKIFGNGRSDNDVEYNTPHLKVTEPQEALPK